LENKPNGSYIQERIFMTSIATPHVSGATTSAAQRGPSRLARARDAVAGWVHAFRAASRAQRPEGIDPMVLMAFGRD
jgi:hypothetical protein